MRKWHVGLYRYGLRLTYDIVIPEPGGTLRETYAQIASLQNQAAQVFTFNLPYSEITTNLVDSNGDPWIPLVSTGAPVPQYEWLAVKYSAQVPTPPASTYPVTAGGTVDTPADTGSAGNVTFANFPISIPDGYQISSVSVSSDIGNNTGGINNQGYMFDVLGYPTEFTDSANTEIIVNELLTGFLDGAQGSQTIYCRFRYAHPVEVMFLIMAQPTDAAWQQWQASVWSALYNAAQTAYYAAQQQINSQIQTLQASITGIDTLTLRREENDEIMKGVLQWMLGPGFDFMPDELSAFILLERLSSMQFDNLVWGINFPGNELFPGTTVANSSYEWNTMATYEQLVRFINDAIDWDDIVYFLYSYFWDVPFAWDNIRNIQHPDATRQAFLRSGSARVVLTVRPGWEAAWIQFVEGGNFGTSASPFEHPYLTIAQEIQDYDNTNYPGIAPANPGGDAAPDDGVYVATASNDTVGPSTGQVTLTVVSSAGFGVGQTAIIDSWEPYASGSTVQTVQEQQQIVAVPDGTHITVAKLLNAHDGSSTPFPVIQAGETGMLIAEWFEYTPTSGTDIAVTSNLETIA
jgi:hypothetical protein